MIFPGALRSFHSLPRMAKSIFHICLLNGHSVQGGAPKVAKLLYNFKFTRTSGRYIELYNISGLNQFVPEGLRPLYQFKASQQKMQNMQFQGPFICATSSSRNLCDKNGFIWQTILAFPQTLQACLPLVFPWSISSRLGMIYLVISHQPSFW